jgi:anti-anti-sigma factor
VTVRDDIEEPEPLGRSLWFMPDGEAVVYLSGNLNSGSAEAVFGYISDVIDRGSGPVVVDLSGIAQCDAVGLQALAHLCQFANQPDDRFQLTSPSDQLIKVMRATRLRLKFSGR